MKSDDMITGRKAPRFSVFEDNELKATDPVATHLSGYEL